jgi:hypothetical protein
VIVFATAADASVNEPIATRTAMRPLREPSIRGLPPHL